MRAKLSAAVLQGQANLFDDLGVGGDGLFRLAGERHPHRRHVNDDRQRAGRQGPAGLRQAVGSPVQPDGRFGDRARALLVLKRDAVGETDDLRQLLRVAFVVYIGRGGVARILLGIILLGLGLAVGQRDLDDERVAAIDGGASRGGRIEIGCDDLLEPGNELIFSDRDHAVGGRGHDLDVLDGIVDGFDLFAVQAPGRNAGR